jgi:uncharacterized protein (DUF488 family)
VSEHARKRSRAWTIGHSTRSLAELVDLLRANGVQHLADVRTVPRSRRHPHFNREALPEPLWAAEIAYTHHPALGGLRRPVAGARDNAGWRNPSFRGFADYMQTPAFREAIEALVALAAGERVAVMCAEAVPWRCHRSLIADALVVRGVEVLHILSPRSVQAHALTAWAVVDGTRIAYPDTGALPGL